MTTRKYTNPTFTQGSLLLIAALIAAPRFHAAAADLVWTNNSGVNMFWSNSANWTNAAGANATPTATDTVTFDHSIGVTNGPGLVNNIVAADITVGPMLFAPDYPGFHTTLINPGVTLTFTNGFATTGDPFSYRAALSDSSATGYVTIRGEGKLVVGNTNSPHSVAGNQIRIHAVSSATPVDGPFMATLDLSGLNYFACAPGEIKVGASATSGKGTRGTLILAKTNLVIAGVTTNNFFGLIIGGATGGNYQPGGSMGDLQLGQVNDVRVNSLRVGGPRAQLGTMRFASGLISPTLRLRNVDGSSAVGLISIGDNFQTGTAGAITSTSETSTGNLELSGGTVDVLVAALRVGRNLNSGTAANNGSGKGTMTWTAGTINCTGLTDIGRQNNNNAGSSTGVMNVLSNAILITDSMRIGTDTGGAAGTGNGTLNIRDGGQVIVANTLIEDVLGAGVSTITVSNGSLRAGGIVRVDSLSVSNASLTLAIGPSINDTNSACSVTNLNLGSPVALNVQGSGFGLGHYPLITYAGAIGGDGYGALVLGSLPARTGGYLSNNTANSSIDIVITSFSGAKWNGDVNGNWDTNTANWIDLANNTGTTYIENTSPGDAVIFDDSLVGTRSVILTTNLSPAAINITNSTAPYIFSGTGRLRGSTGLNKSGSSSLVLTNSGTNDFTGPVSIKEGTLKLGLAADRLPTLANVTLDDVAGVTLDLGDQNQSLASLSGGGSTGGEVKLGSGALTTTGSGSFLGVISGAGTFRKSSTGTQTLGGANTYGGGTFVSGGAVTLSNPTGSGVGTGPVTISSGATLNLGNGGAGGLIPASTTITNGGTLNFNTTDDFTLNGVISGGGGVTKNNINTVTLTAANTYTGPTTINVGALRISNGAALGTQSSGTTINATADERLELEGNITVPENLALPMKGSGLGQVGHVVNLSGTNTLTGAISGTSGGSYWAFRSDAGKLIVNGTFTFTAAATLGRTLRLFGAGDGDWVTTFPDGVVAGSFGRIRKEDTGTWTLSGTNTYTGDTSAFGGSLLVNGQIQSLGTLTVGSTGLPTTPALLGGTGIIYGVVVVNPNGILSPGNSIGTLTISNNLTLLGTNIMEVSHTNNDKVAGISTFSPGGTLQVLVIGTLSGGEVFHLFEAATFSGGDFASYDLPALPSPLAWDTSMVPVDGTLKVIGGTPPAPTIAPVTISGGNLVVSVPTVSGANYVLQSTTNLVPPIAWSNESTNAGTGASLNLNVPIEPAKPHKFLRFWVY